MPTAYLALTNPIMKSFLRNSQLFSIQDNKEQQYDFVFCDTLELMENVISKVKIYICDNRFESIINLSSYADFDYFIGFGLGIYKIFDDKIGFECSKVFDGFVYDREYEGSFEDKGFDILVVTDSPTPSFFESMHLFNMAEIPYFLYNMGIRKKFKIGTNIQKILFQGPTKKHSIHSLNPRHQDIMDLCRQSEFLDFHIPLKYINNSKIIYFISSLDTRIYYDKSINTKTIYPHHLNSTFLELNKQQNPDEVNYPKDIRVYIEMYKENSNHEIALTHDILAHYFNDFKSRINDPQISNCISPGASKVVNNIMAPDLMAGNIKNVNDEFMETIKKLIQVNS